MVNFKYPKKNNFKTLSFTPSEQTILNEIPRYSLSFYDDQNFTYKRQSKNGRQILSKVISDDFYPFNLSSSDRTNYINGQENNLKVFFVKILVYKSIVQDTIGQTSNVFYLTRTQSLGQYKTVYYLVTCIGKNDNFTTYSAKIPLKNSDYIFQYDGETFFTLVGDYSVSLSYPISLTINNSASTSISQTTNTPVFKTISSQNNNLNFFENVTTAFNYFQYSDSFDFDFQPLNITLSNNLFNTVSTIYTTNNNQGTSIRFNFLKGYNFSTLKYFGLTIKNTSLNYNPANDTQFLLNFKTSDENFTIIDACSIFENASAGFFNVIFDFDNVVFPSNILNYLILEIKTSSGLVTDSYQISYMNFIKKVANTSSFSVKSLNTTKNLNNFTLNPVKRELSFESLSKQTILLSDSLYSSVDCLIYIEDEANYEIKTKSSSIILPESCLIKTDKLYVPIFNLKKNTSIYYFEKLEVVESIKILPPSKLELIDTDDNSDYVFNGYKIKNPFYLRKVERKLLPVLNKEMSFIEINRERVAINKYDNLGWITEDLNLHSENYFYFPGNVSEVRLMFKSSSEVLFENSNNFSVDMINNVYILKNKNDLSNVVLKCKSSLVIKKMLLIYAD